jgi:hypothetical protein
VFPHPEVIDNSFPGCSVHVFMCLACKMTLLLFNTIGLNGNLSALC